VQNDRAVLTRDRFDLGNIVRLKDWKRLSRYPQSIENIVGDRLHDDKVHALALDLRPGEPFGAIPQRQYGGQGRSAHDDANHGEGGAKWVRTEALERGLCDVCEGGHQECRREWTTAGSIGIKPAMTDGASRRRRNLRAAAMGTDTHGSITSERQTISPLDGSRRC
jgi:hypothetical protein